MRFDRKSPAKRSSERRRALFLVLVFVLQVGSFSACLSARRKPDMGRIFAEARARKGKRPIIIIPGVLGSQLVNTKTREIAWPALLRSSTDGLALPMTPDLLANRDNLVAEKIIDTIKLSRLTPEIYFYRELLDALRDYAGYQEGNWDNPSSNGDADTFYVFPYDWRRDNVESARLLIRRIELLKKKLGKTDLKFNILAHSMGGLIARYAVGYGDADIPSSNVETKPTWAGAKHISRILMFGTPNEGSADAFATLLNGYSITSGLRRRIPLLNKLSREDVLSAPAIFQLLPHSASVRFLDNDLRPITVDLYDPAQWKKYGWGAIADNAFRHRYQEGKERLDDVKARVGSLEQLDAFFAVVLARSKQFQVALDATLGVESPVPLLAFGGDCEDTLVAPVLLHDAKRKRWITITTPQEVRASDGHKFSKRDVTKAMFGPGDGRVTRRSMLAEDLVGRRRSTIFDTPLPIVYGVFACEMHSDIPNNKTIQDNALTALVGEMIN